MTRHADITSTHQSLQKRPQIYCRPVRRYELHHPLEMFPKPCQIRYLLPSKNRQNNLSRMLPNLAVRNKDSLSNPACIGLPSDTLDAEVLELGGIDRLYILYLGGVDDGLAQHVGLECLSVVAKEALKHILVVAFTFAGHRFSVQI